MLHELTVFAVKHWALVSAFVVIFILLLLEESISQSEDTFQLSVLQVTQLMNHENAAVIDVRETNAFKDGHIIGAKNIISSDCLPDSKLLAPYRNQSLIIVDSTGSTAVSLASRLKKAGFEKATVLKGGINAWKEAGMPVVNDNKMKKKGK